MTSLAERGARAGLAVMVVCAVIMTAAVVRRDFFAPAKQRVRAALPTHVANWGEVVSSGHRRGPRDAPVTIVEFADLQCPACKWYRTHALEPVLKNFPAQVAVVFRHWPLPMHPNAYAAARASECAATQGRFYEFTDRVFDKQDSLQSKPLIAYAKESGVPDLAAFASCSSDTAAVPAVRVDVALIQRLGARGTPTLVVNGLLYLAPPDSAALDSLVRNEIARLRTGS